jgi:hypothetical protein
MVVLGMHRSGTSALARVLNLLGCDLPTTLMASAESNVTGHWESQIITDFDDALLESAGSSWDDWVAFNPGWYHSPKAEEFKERAQKLLEEEFGPSRLFVLKDPRMCRILPFWLDVLDAAKVKPAIVIPIRNPLEVASSLAARDGFDPEFGHLLWLRHVMEAEADSRGRQRFFCSYDSLISARSRFVLSVQDVLGVSFPRMSVRVNDEIDAFVSKQHRHHSFQSHSVSENFALSSWLRDAYGIFERWAKDGERSEDFVVLDGIRNEFNAATPAFVRVTTSGRHARRITELEADAARLSAERDDASAIIVALQAQQIERENAANDKRERLQDEIHALRQALTEHRDRLSYITTDRDINAAKLADAHDQIVKMEKQQAEEADRLRGELATLRRMQREDSEAISRMAERLEVTATELVMLRSKLAEAGACVAECERLKQYNVETETQYQLREQKLLCDLDLAERRQSERCNEIAILTKLLRDREAEIREEKRKIEVGEERSKAVLEQALRAEARLKERFKEVATLTQVLREKEAELLSCRNEADWLRKTSTVMFSGSGWRGRLAALLPGFVVRLWSLVRLKNGGLFDAKRYLEANPDVARNGVDPLYHYLHHGMKEGRKLNL